MAAAVAAADAYLASHASPPTRLPAAPAAPTCSSTRCRVPPAASRGSAACSGRNTSPGTVATLPRPFSLVLDEYYACRAADRTILYTRIPRIGPAFAASSAPSLRRYLPPPSPEQH